MKVKEPKIQTNLRLTESDRAMARKAGNGDITAGFRLAIKLLAQSQKPIKT